MPFKIFIKVLCVFTLYASLAGCKENRSVPPPQRSQAVARKNVPADEAIKKAEAKFCEVVFPDSGEGVRVHQTLKTRGALPDGKKHKPVFSGKTRWVNFWATWCGPCVDEIPLLKQWDASLKKDGLSLSVELWSADDDEKALARWLKSDLAKDTDVRWLAQGTLLRAMESFGVEKNTPIPLHAIIDKNNNVRCVRVGAVHARDYPAVKALIHSYQ